MKCKVRARSLREERIRERRRVDAEQSVIIWSSLNAIYSRIKRSIGEGSLEKKIYVVGMMPAEGRSAILRKVAEEGEGAALITLPVEATPLEPGEWLAVRFERVKTDLPVIATSGPCPSSQ